MVTQADSATLIGKTLTNSPVHFASASGSAAGLFLPSSTQRKANPMSNRLAGRRLTLDDLKPAAPPPPPPPEPQPAPPVVQEKSAALPSFLPKPLAEAPHNPASAKSRKRQAVWDAP